MNDFKQSTLAHSFLKTEKAQTTRRRVNFTHHRRYIDLFERCSGIDAIRLARAEDELMAMMAQPDFQAFFDMRLQQMVLSLDGARLPALRARFQTNACQTLGRLRPVSHKRRKPKISATNSFSLS